MTVLTPSPPGIRFLLGLFAALPAALVGAMLLHLFPPPGLPPLAQRPLWPVWCWLALWLLMGALLAWPRRPAAWLWRGGLLALAALLGLAALVTLAGLPQGLAMAVALAVLAGACLVMRRRIGEGKVRPERPPKGLGAAKARTVPAPAPPNAATHAATQAATHAATHAPRWTRRVMALRAHLARHAGFWLCGALMLECFRLAHGVGADPQRGVGMVGMLLVFFLALPAVSLAAWLPRSAAVLLGLAAAGFGGLAWLSGLLAPLCAGLLLAALLVAGRRTVSRTEGADERRTSP